MLHDITKVFPLKITGRIKEIKVKIFPIRIVIIIGHFYWKYSQDGKF